MHTCPVTPRDAVERLYRLAAAAERLHALPRLEARAIRSIAAEAVKDLASVSVAATRLGLPQEFQELAAHCARLLSEVAKAAATVEALAAAGAPGPHEEALRRLARLIAEDGCMSRLRTLLEPVLRGRSQNT